MRLRIAELLAERQMTPYQLCKQSNGRISMTVAYRLAKNQWRCLSSDVLETLCDVLDLSDTGPLFEREKPKKRR